MPGDQTMTKAGPISHDLAQEVVTDAIRRHVGRGKRFSVASLSEATGIDERTLKSYRAGDTCPALHFQLEIARCLGDDGPAFMNEILAIAELGGVERLERAKVDALGTAGELSVVVTEILERLQDGKFCHRDQAQVGPLLRALAGKLEAQATAMAGKQVHVIGESTA